MHVTYPIGDGTLLMASDKGGWGPELVVGNNFSISVNPDSEEEAQRIFHALSEGGIVTMPIEKTFWNALFGSTIDKFGINWMVNYSYPSPEH